MSGPLDRERLVKLFDELSAELRFSRTRAQIYIVGGAAMSLAFDRERTTRDVDARIDTGHSRLVEAVVTGASANHLLAMKLPAGRNKDREDVAVLAEHLKLKEPGDAIRIYKDLFPDEKLKPQARQVLDWAFRTRIPEHQGPER